MIQPNCKDCPLGNEPQVPGIGTRTEGTKLLAVRDENAPFKLAVVATAPAQEELMRKIPMVGPSGQFARKIFNQLGLTDYYLTNCLLCPIMASHTTEQIKKAQQCCSQRLYSELQAHKPQLILAFGDMPFNQLCNNELSIMEHQGRLFMSHLDIPLVPVAHPAYYLRRPDDAYDFIECTRAGVRYLQNNYQQVGKVDRTLVTEDNVEQVLQILWQFPELTVDTETEGLHVMGLHPDRLLEVGISGDDRHCYILQMYDTSQYTQDNPVLIPDVGQQLLPRFQELLQTKPVNGWNLAFDWRASRTNNIDLKNMTFDGMLAHYCLDERQHSHGLKKCVRVYCGADNWESEAHTYLPNKKASFALIPQSIRQEYLSKDVCYSHTINTFLKKEVQNHWAFHNILMPATRVFSNTTFRGVRIDPYKVVEMHKLLSADIEADRSELWELAGKYFEPTSPKDVAELIYDDLHIPEDPREGRSTNKKILEKLRDKYELIDRIILHREMKHDLSQYVEGFARRIDHDFKVHPTVKLFGTVTGRISSEDPSIMNIKRDSENAPARIKELFIADEGKLLAEFDLSGAELRWYCLYAEDQVLYDILTNGYQGDLGFELTDKQRRDPHFIIGAIAYGKDRAKELRAAAKMTVFGRIYLRGLESIERQYGAEVGRKLVSTMDKIVPNHSKYTTKIRRQIQSQGYVESYFKRQRRFPIIPQDKRGEYERQAVNMPIQSACSDLNLLNLIWLYEHKEEFNVEPMFTVHDSIMVQIPDKSVIKPIKQAMEDNANRIVEGRMPFRYDCKVGPRWGGAEEWKE